MCRHVLGAVPQCLVGVQAPQPGSSARRPHKYLDLVLQLQHQIFVLFFSLLYFNWVGNVLWAGNGNVCFLSTWFAKKRLELFQSSRNARIYQTCMHIRTKGIKIQVAASCYETFNTCLYFINFQYYTEFCIVFAMCHGEICIYS